MNRVEVISSNIRSVGFERMPHVGTAVAVGVERGTLEVEFHPSKKDGAPSIWRYFDVPAALHDGLMKAESVGTFFHHAVRMGGFRSEKVETEDEHGHDGVCGYEAANPGGD